MSAFTKFVKKYEVLIGMGLLMGCVQFSWNMMQHQMETGEQNKESPWLRAPKAVSTWAFGKKATDEEEYRPPFEVESEKK